MSGAAGVDISDPARVVESEWARDLAAAVARKAVGGAADDLIDDVENAALAGVWEAANKYDPASGVPWRAYAYHTATRRAKDRLRELRSCGQRRAGKWSDLKVIREGDGPEESAFNLAAVPSEELPIGWEVESEDGVHAIAGKLPPRCALAVRTFYLAADATTMKRVGRAMGVTDSAVSRMLAQAKRITVENAAIHGGDRAAC